MEPLLFIVTAVTGSSALYQFDMMRVDFARDPYKSNKKRYVAGMVLAVFFFTAAAALIYYGNHPKH